MLLIFPRLVRFGAITLNEVYAVAFTRDASSVILEQSDEGPHPVFADTQARRATALVKQSLTREDPTDLIPGALATLTIETASATASGARRTHSATAMLLSAQTDLKAAANGVSGGSASGALATRTLTFVLLSPDGATDPITTI